MSAFRPNRSDVTLSGLTVSGNEGPSVARASQRWAMAMESRWDSRAGASRKQMGAARGLTLSDQIKANAEPLRVDATLGTPAEVAEGSRAERDRLPKGARRVRAAARIGAVSGDRAGAEVGGAINRRGSEDGRVPAGELVLWWDYPKAQSRHLREAGASRDFGVPAIFPPRLSKDASGPRGLRIRRRLRYAGTGRYPTYHCSAFACSASARQAKMNESSHVCRLTEATYSGDAARGRKP